jgi:hypothetical protein
MVTTPMLPTCLGQDFGVRMHLSSLACSLQASRLLITSLQIVRSHLQPGTGDQASPTRAGLPDTCPSHSCWGTASKLQMGSCHEPNVKSSKVLRPKAEVCNSNIWRRGRHGNDRGWSRDPGKEPACLSNSTQIFHCSKWQTWGTAHWTEVA